MIRFADTVSEKEVRQMWKTVFQDADSYMDIYFREKYRNENTLVYFEGDKAVASLQMLPYQFTFCDEEIPITYLSGVCTLPEARKKGYMRELLIRCMEVLRERVIPLAVLVPQEEWLLAFYQKFGFAQTFDAGAEELPSLKTLLDSHSKNISTAYQEFDGWFRNKEMVVQKSFDDFRAIVEEAECFDFPTKTSLIGMARAVCPEILLSIFAKKYPEKSFSVNIQDPILAENYALFTIQNSHIKKDKDYVKPLFNLDIAELTQLLLGYHASDEKPPLDTIFPEKHPQMHFMME